MAVDKEREGVLARSRDEEEEEVERGSVTRTKRRLRGEKRGGEIYTQPPSSCWITLGALEELTRDRRRGRSRVLRARQRGRNGEARKRAG